MAQEHITEDGEIIVPGSMLAETSAAVEMVRAEIDSQITTARAYPRSLSRAMKTILEIVTLDEESAIECMYRLPRAGGTPIIGPSIRFAEAVKQSFGNCRAEAFVSGVNKVEGWVEATAVFLDLESNTATKVSRRRRITDKRGNIYKDDMVIVTSNAACAVAMRECILQAVPKPLWRGAFEKVNNIVRGDAKTLVERRSRAVTAFAAFGIDPEKVFTLIGVKGMEDITLDHLPELFAAYQAIKNGEETVESMFNPRRIGSNHETVADPLAVAKETVGGEQVISGDAEQPKDAQPERGKSSEDNSSKAETESKSVKQEPQIMPKEADLSPEALDVWRKKGEKRQRVGASRTLPKELQPENMKPAADAWLAGYDAPKSEAKEG
jgi:hypothetical protein